MRKHVIHRALFVILVACGSKTSAPPSNPVADASAEPRPPANATPSQRDNAVANAVMAEACTDTKHLDTIESDGDAKISAGQFAAALASYELVFRCKPAALPKAYLAACRARAFPKAQAYFSQFSESRRDGMSMICLKEGYDPRQAAAKPANQCACATSVGVPIEETYCGYLVCGTDHQVYRCTNKQDISPWVLVQPIQQCPAPGRLPTTQPSQAIELGTDCSKGEACASGASCVSYRGIAGARGPEFKTCEIKCADIKSCPGGTKCMTIADGPGRVCR